MNLRIQELAVEARQYAFGEVENSQDPTEWSTKYYNEMFEQKFAELIVRECVAICKDIDGEDNTDARSGRQDCAVEIREHFGVEE